MIHLNDHTMVSKQWLVDAQGNGHCKLTYHGLANKTLELPIGMVPTLKLIQQLYISLKG